ncbi:heterokaryon incompatibility het-6 [Fusarium coicis]|nr:heterokaryon incompatibility het-6 [Fusarium coicis]
MPRFPYPPLFPGEIRLLELEPGMSDDRLTGTIFHRKLLPENGEIPDFEALSYCWGDQSHPEQIKLTIENPTVGEQSHTPSDFGDIDIGPNLASALRALRYTNLPRIIWCDSICINQQDVIERSGQVQRMHDIYEFASRVVIWLGPATSWSHTAMEMLRWVAKILTLPGLLIPEDLCIPYGSRLVSTADGNETIDFRDPHLLTQDQWLAFEQLLALEWHRRLWTYQEIFLANQETCIVRLGSEEMTWIKFKNAGLFVCTCRHPPWEFLLDPDSCHTNKEAFILRATTTERTNKRCRDWLTLLVFTNPYHCSDNRDRLYALRGLMAPAVARRITVDYTKSLKQILSSALIVHLSQQKNLRFLEYCDSDVYPSWVVDLERPLNPPVLRHDACRSSACSATLIESGILEVAGVPCDEIGDDPYIFPGQKPFEECMADMVQRLVGNGLHHDDDSLNELLTVMGYGNFWDYSMNRTRFAPDERSMSLEKVREIIRELMADPSSTSLPSRLRSILTLGQVSGYTKTRNGSFVRVPTGSRRGDIIVTLLGLRSNLVLRPQPKEGSYLVIGPCYHPSFADGQALLGDHFRGWQRGWCTSTSMLAFWKEGPPVQRSDPRLDGVSLPDGYTERVISTSSSEFQRPVWIHKDWNCKSAMQESGHDPRMSEDELKKRGVPIQRFRLI